VEWCKLRQHGKWTEEQLFQTTGTTEANILKVHSAFSNELLLL